MLTYHACSKCDAPVRRSRRKNLLEFLVGPIMLPYRCTICDRREMKLRFIEHGPGAHYEADLIITEPTERERDEQKKAELKAAEKAAKKAEKQKKKEKGKKARGGEPGAPEEEEEAFNPPIDVHRTRRRNKFRRVNARARSTFRTRSGEWRLRSPASGALFLSRFFTSVSSIANRAIADSAV